MGELKQPELEEEEGSAGTLGAAGVQHLGEGRSFGSYVATRQSPTQQSTLRKLERVKEFLGEKSQRMALK